MNNNDTGAIIPVICYLSSPLSKYTIDCAYWCPIRLDYRSSIVGVLKGRQCIPFATTSFTLGFLMGSVLLIFLVVCVVILLVCLSSSCVLCAQCCQCLWIDCPFLIAPSVFSNFWYLLCYCGQLFENV